MTFYVKPQTTPEYYMWQRVYHAAGISAKGFFFHKIASRAPISSMKSLNEDYHHKISQAHLDLNLVVSLFISNFAGCYAPQPPLIQYHTKQGMKHVLIKQRRIMDIMAKIKKSM